VAQCFSRLRPGYSCRRQALGGAAAAAQPDALLQLLLLGLTGWAYTAPNLLECHVCHRSLGLRNFLRGRGGCTAAVATSATGTAISRAPAGDGGEGVGSSSPSGGDAEARCAGRCGCTPCGSTGVLSVDHRLAARLGTRSTAAHRHHHHHLERRPSPSPSPSQEPFRMTHDALVKLPSHIRLNRNARECACLYSTCMQ
jgi:hypothetical protein